MASATTANDHDDSRPCAESREGSRFNKVVSEESAGS